MIEVCVQICWRRVHGWSRKKDFRHSLNPGSANWTFEAEAPGRSSVVLKALAADAEMVARPQQGIRPVFDAHYAQARIVHTCFCRRKQRHNPGQLCCWCCRRRARRSDQGWPRVGPRRARWVRGCTGAAYLLLHPRSIQTPPTAANINPTPCSGSRSLYSGGRVQAHVVGILAASGRAAASPAFCCRAFCPRITTGRCIQSIWFGIVCASSATSPANA